MDPIAECQKYDILVEGLIHVGANRAKEYHQYQAAQVEPLLYLEAIPELVEFVQAKLDKTKAHYIREATVSDVAGERLSFNVSSNDGKSSSMLPLGLHAQIYPTVTYSRTISVVTERLDDIIMSEYPKADFNVLVMDIQGAELKALMGAPWLLSRVDAVFSEVSSEALYEGGCTFLEITNFLASHGFLFRNAVMCREGWGDAFYSRKRTRLTKYVSTNLAVGKPAQQSSIYRGRFNASMGVNGAPAPTFNVHTAEQDQAAWWQVDLLEVLPVRRIIYLDRPGFEQRARTLQIQLSNDGIHYETVFDRSAAGVTPVISVALEKEARFVRLALTEPNPLHFRQLIVL